MDNWKKFVIINDNRYYDWYSIIDIKILWRIFDLKLIKK